jgi:hypothetical protein
MSLLGEILIEVAGEVAGEALGLNSPRAAAKYRRALGPVVLLVMWAAALGVAYLSLGHLMHMSEGLAFNCVLWFGVFCPPLVALLSTVFWLHRLLSRSKFFRHLEKNISGQAVIFAWLLSLASILSVVRWAETSSGPGGLLVGATVFFGILVPSVATWLWRRRLSSERTRREKTAAVWKRSA